MLVQIMVDCTHPVVKCKAIVWSADYSSLNTGLRHCHVEINPVSDGSFSSYYNVIQSIVHHRP